jgi:excisionase family DNA binding protein
MRQELFNSLLTPDQASEYLGVSRQTLAIWRCNNRYPLPYVKVGRYVRYKLVDLVEFVETRTVGAEQ